MPGERGRLEKPRRYSGHEGRVGIDGARRGRASLVAYLAHHTVKTREEGRSRDPLDAEPAKEAILSALNERDLCDLQRAVEPIAASYPRFPMAFIFAGIERSLSPDLPRLKEVIRALFDRGGTLATHVQGHAVGLAMMIGCLKVMESSMLAKIDQIGDYPHTETSEAVGSAVRAAVSALHSGGPNPRTRNWPALFWARGLELEPCEVES